MPTINNWSVVVNRYTFKIRGIISGSSKPNLPDGVEIITSIVKECTTTGVITESGNHYDLLTPAGPNEKMILEELCKHFYHIKASTSPPLV